MEESIFLTIKNSLGVESTFTGFDNDILLGINTSIMSLNQLGIGPAKGLIITGQYETWDQLIGTFENLEGVKTYIGLKTRLIFDPPASSFVLDSMKNIITELESRLMLQAESNSIIPPAL